MLLIHFVAAAQKFAKLRANRAHVPCVPTCLTCLRACVPSCFKLSALIFHVPTCLRAYVLTCLCALDYFEATSAHFSHTYVSTTTQVLVTDIYPADVRSDENQYFNTSAVVSQDLLV